LRDVKVHIFHGIHWAVENSHTPQ